MATAKTKKPAFNTKPTPTTTIPNTELDSFLLMVDYAKAQINIEVEFRIREGQDDAATINNRTEDILKTIVGGSKWA